MIKVDHIITFPETNGLLLIDPLPSVVTSALLVAREEATSRGCILFSYENDEKTERTATFIWENEAVMNEFLEWAEALVNYSTVHNEFIEYVESKGGSVTRTITEF